MCLSPESDDVAPLSASSLMSAREMMAPFEARSWAVARPMPDAAPVIAIWGVSIGGIGEGRRHTTLPSKDAMAVCDKDF